MKDMVLLGSIAVFWFTLSFILTAIAQDPYISSASYNSTFTIDNSSVQLNYSELPASSQKLNVNYGTMLGALFSFRVPSLISMPAMIGVIISFINWFSVLFLILIAFRMIRSGSG